MDVAQPGGAIVIDLRDLTSIDTWGLRTLERAMHRAGGSRGRLSIVNGHDPVIASFDSAGLGHLLSGTNLSDLLDGGEGEWSPVSLPPSLLGRRVSSGPRVAPG